MPQESPRSTIAFRRRPGLDGKVVAVRPPGRPASQDRRKGGVDPGAAAQLVVAGAAEQKVVAVAAQQPIVAVAPSSRCRRRGVSSSP